MRQRCLQCWQVFFLYLFLIHKVCQRHALCMVISFLIFWSICLSSSLVPFRKGPENVTRDIAQVFIPLIRFLLESFVSSSFLIFRRYSFWILSFISTCLMVSLEKLQGVFEVRQKTINFSLKTMIYFGLVLWHINHCSSFNTKFSL